ncbi:MAG: hypothetical protein AMXMBFR7_36030 [Planctomycetota bacterium]
MSAHPGSNPSDSGSAPADRLIARLVEGLPSLLLGLDVHDRIVYLNSCAERVLGLSRETALGRALPECGWPGRVEPVLKAARDCRYSAHPVALEQPFRNPQGAPSLLGLTLKSIPDALDGQPVILIYGADITTRMGITDLEMQTQKLEALGRLSAGIAHDFNNMLTVVMAACELIQREEIRPKIQQHVKDIHESAERAAQLVRQLLAFGRNQPSSPEQVDLHDALNTAQTMLNRLIGENIELKTCFDAALSTVKVDPAQLTQVVVNLIVNARDAMPDGGTILLRTSQLELDSTTAAGFPGLRPGLYVVLDVQDNGIGMDPETQRRAFEPFFTTKQRRKGTGLGLSIIHGIMLQNSGDVQMYSRPGEGTTVRLFFPYAGECIPHAPQLQPSPDEEMTGTEKVLVVEDDAGIRTLLQDALDVCGYDVRSASDGDDMFALFERQPDFEPDLLVTDMMLPGINGYELAGRVQARFPDCRILFMTGYSEPLRKQGLSIPPRYILEKPFAPPELLLAMRRILGEPALSLTSFEI